MPAWRPVTPPSRRWLKKQPRGCAHRAQAAVVDLAHAGGVQLPARRSRAGRASGRSVPKRARSVVADLVAARPRAPGPIAAATGASSPARPRSGAHRPRPGCRRPARASRRAPWRRPPARPARPAGSRPSARRGRRRGRAVAWPSASSPRPLSTATVVPWTWCPCRSRRPPASAARRRRFSATSPGSSSVHGPRFSVAYGPADTPPRRVVKRTWPCSRSRASWPSDQRKGAGTTGSATTDIAVRLVGRPVRPVQRGAQLGVAVRRPRRRAWRRAPGAGARPPRARAGRPPRAGRRP